jgi:hypothetical protein
MAILGVAEIIFAVDDLDLCTRFWTDDQLINSPKRGLKIFDARTGGIEHVSVDNMSYGRTFIAESIAETFHTRTV